MNNIRRTMQNREQQAVVPPKEHLEAMLAQVGMLIDRKQQIVEGIALFHDGVNKLLAALPTAVPSVAVDAITNMQTGALAIAKGHAGILLAELEELKGTCSQMEAQLATYGNRIQLPPQ